MTVQKSDAPPSAVHRTDVLSLIFGLFFLGVAGWWAASYYFDWAITWHLPDVGWILAGGLILLGLIGILASLRRDRRDAPTSAVDPVPVPGAPTMATDPGAVDMPAGPRTVRPDDPGPEPHWPAARDATTDLAPPAAGDPTTERDRPAPGDPGGHRPA